MCEKERCNDRNRQFIFKVFHLQEKNVSWEAEGGGHMGIESLASSMKGLSAFDLLHIMVEGWMERERERI